MKRLALAIAATALAAACKETTGPSGARYLLLSGVFEAASVTPGGFLTKIAITAAGGGINGIGVVFTASGTDTMKIGGRFEVADSSFALDINFQSGKTAAFAGHVLGTDSLTGAWTDWSTSQITNVTFTRLDVPPCSDSVPLLGTFNPSAPDFIVRFQDTVNAAVESARLGALYGFTPTSVYTSALRGFAAAIPMSTVTVLRCEAKVTSVSYDAVGSGS